MTDRIDHADLARRNMQFVQEHSEDIDPPEATVTLLAAQVHAALALVEQQRIANLVALMDSPRTATSVARVAERALTQGEPVVNRELRPDIAAALGIEVAK